MKAAISLFRKIPHLVLFRKFKFFILNKSYNSVISTQEMGSDQVIEKTCLPENNVPDEPKHKYSRFVKLSYSSSTKTFNPFKIFSVEVIESLLKILAKEFVNSLGEIYVYFSDSEKILNFN